MTLEADLQLQPSQLIQDVAPKAGPGTTAPGSCTCDVSGEAVVLFPQTQYAARLIEILWEHHGVRTIAVSRNWRDRLVHEHRFPVLKSEAVSASYVLGRHQIDDLARTLRRRHRVVAVIPHHESTVAPLGKLADDLRLNWAQPDVLPLFRNKVALKATLRANDPSLRVNKSAMVRSAEEVRELVEEWGVDRFVVKPNDGFANTRVQFFDRDSSLAELREHLRWIDGPAVLEEYIEGDEFNINGQVDHLGRPRVLAVNRYRHVAVHGKPNVLYGQYTIPVEDPRHAMLVDYSQRVVSATGLRRSPFHLEARLDGEGPSLIEVAARLIGMRTADLDSLHSGIDVFAAAAHYYLHDCPFPEEQKAMPQPQIHTRAAMGISDSDGRMHQVQGVAEAERLPGFLDWWQPPIEGKHVNSTVDLESTPWCALFAGEDPAELGQSAAAARRLLRWRTDDPGPWGRLADTARRGWRCRPRLSMLRTRVIAPNWRTLAPRRSR